MHGVVDGGRGVPRDLRDGADRTDHAGVGGSEALGAVAGDSAVPAGRQTVLGEGEAGPPAVAIATACGGIASRIRRAGRTTSPRLTNSRAPTRQLAMSEPRIVNESDIG